MEYYIKEVNWKQILEFIKSVKGMHSKDEKRLRIFIEAVWYVARSGFQCRLLPKIYGHYRSVHKRFKRWCERGIWKNLLEYTKQEPDLEAVIIDGTIVRAHQCSAGYTKNSKDQEALGRNKGGFTTKIHALVDALGNPLKFTLTAGQRNEITQAATLTESVYNTTLVADKGYDSNAFVTNLERKVCTAVIPPKRNRKVQRGYDKHVYKERHLIECFFGKIKNFRRIFPDLIKLLRFLRVFSILLELLYGFSKILFTEPRGGRKNKLSEENMLLMILEYLREYRTYFHIAQSYGISESAAYKTVKWVEDTLIGHPDFVLPGRKELLKSDIEYEVLVLDSTETPIERPKKKQSSGKKKKHTLKLS